MIDFNLEKKIKELSRIKGISIRQLCLKIEMTENGLNKSLKNNTLKIDTLQKIAKAFNVSVGSFFEYKSLNQEDTVFINFFKISKNATKNREAALKSTYENYLIDIYKKTLFDDNQLIPFLIEIFSSIDIDFYNDENQRAMILEKIEKLRDSITLEHESYYEILPQDILIKIDNKFMKISQHFVKKVLHDPIFDILLIEKIMSIETIFIICKTFLDKYNELSRPSLVRRICFGSDDDPTDIGIDI